MEAKATKHSSQKRQRQGLAKCFVNAAEKAEIEEKAARAGLSVSGYLRALVFGKDAPQPRGARRPAVEKELLVRLLGEIGKIGSNVNQIAHVANQGRGVNYPALVQLSADVVVMRQQVKAALGRGESEELTPLPEGDNP
ncbi:plasmid mobilization protein [Candidatus Magnetaquicoccus inordinatus]|uniref:plasmid mobilization protein n=1 Tax=Candidatus Magnetaquicoccus inordinatus TaxID=2496818 RepID=UPI00102C3CC5|nr:plasmid mobilization relaxosome protein MobC [Candidatus Magnetaquicoccus inordinatus]